MKTSYLLLAALVLTSGHSAFSEEFTKRRQEELQALQTFQRERLKNYAANPLSKTLDAQITKTTNACAIPAQVKQCLELLQGANGMYLNLTKPEEDKAQGAAGKTPTRKPLDPTRAPSENVQRQQKGSVDTLTLKRLLTTKFPEGDLSFDSSVKLIGGWVKKYQTLIATKKTPSPKAKEAAALIGAIDKSCNGSGIKDIYTAQRGNVDVAAFLAANSADPIACVNAMKNGMNLRLLVGELEKSK